MKKLAENDAKSNEKSRKSVKNHAKREIKVSKKVLKLLQKCFKNTLKVPSDDNSLKNDEKLGKIGTQMGEFDDF